MRFCSLKMIFHLLWQWEQVTTFNDWKQQRLQFTVIFVLEYIGEEVYILYLTFLFIGASGEFCHRTQLGFLRLLWWCWQQCSKAWKLLRWLRRFYNKCFTYPTLYCKHTALSSSLMCVCAHTRVCFSYN